jgi:hypothetical protein
MKSEEDVREEIKKRYSALFDDNKDALDVRQVSEYAYEVILMGKRALISSELIHECFSEDPRDQANLLVELERVFRELRRFPEG